MSELTILQIGDLHRGKANGVGNAALLDSILTDLKYNIPDVLPIDIVVVCGDIVQGVVARDLAAAEQLVPQYQEAESFLIDLSKELLNGNRERMVIVPGNHDISWAHSHCSMRKKDINTSTEGRRKLIHSLVQESRTPSSAIRWSWEDLKFMELHERSLYSQRMKYFCDFFNSFYNGTKTYELETGDQFIVYDYADLAVSVLGLNSCDCVDHCNLAARLNPDALAGAFMFLKKPQYAERTKIAVWHHGLAGQPHRTDYLDPLSVQGLIVNRFVLGLHGHQHVPDFMNEIGKFGYNSRMVVVGTGTLCGPTEALPTGQMRSYNVLRLDTNSGELELYPREMKESPYDSPVWGKKLLAYNDDYPIHAKLCQATEGPRKAPESDTVLMKDLSVAEARIGASDYEGALEILHTMDRTNAMVRSFMVECYVQLHQHKNIVELCIKPTSVREAIYVLAAADELNDSELIGQLLDDDFIAAYDDPSLAQYRKKLQRRRTK